jgi:hypothetical protein
MKEENFRKWSDRRSANLLGNKQKVWVMGGGLGLLAFTLSGQRTLIIIYFNGLLPASLAQERGV